MTAQQVDQPEPSTPVTPSNRRSRLGLAKICATSLVTALALVFGVLWGLNSRKLSDTEPQIEALNAQVAGLEQQVTDAKDTRDGLQQELAAAKERSTEELADIKKDKVDIAAREVAADKRDEQLDAREKSLEDQESSAAIPEDSPESPNDASSDTDFDQPYLIDIATDIIEDVQTVDERLPSGSGVSSALSLLTDSYGRMADAGVPPGLDAATYLARITTLQSFASDATDLYDADPQEATAKYSVIRDETETLFEEINGALGTNFQLP